MAEATEQRNAHFAVVLSHLLRAGVILAAAVVLAGGVLYLMQHRGPAPLYKVFHGEPADFRYARHIVRDALSGHGPGLIELGLLLLIGTPIARVAFSVVEFAIERDWLYVFTTAVVLAILIYSLVSS
ncbi:MAG TPA: DUF1634 domain-containing protein [Candidatus Acidoferrum sp.]|nr:DUF1634 domain-containing protein [Candidatus Acidoferrum sp.]